MSMEIVKSEKVMDKISTENGIDFSYDLILCKSDKEDFWAFGTKADLSDKYGFPVDHCGSRREVYNTLCRCASSDYWSETEKCACTDYAVYLAETVVYDRAERENVVLNERDKESIFFELLGMVQRGQDAFSHAENTPFSARCQRKEG